MNNSKNGGDGPAIKKLMKGTSYRMGRVYCEDERVGQWDERAGMMILKGQGRRSFIN